MVPGGSLDFTTGTVILSKTPPDAGVPAGFVIIYAWEVGTNFLLLQGNGQTLITGKVYAPHSTLKYPGTSDFGFSGGPIVIGGLVSNGNHATLTLSDAVSATLSRKLGHLTQ